MRIAVDFDSVLSDLSVLQVLSYNLKYGACLKKEDINDWWWWNDIENSDYIWSDECFNNRDWMLATPPVEGAVAGARDLSGEGHELYVISDRKEHHVEWIREWLRRHRIRAEDVIVTSRDSGYTKVEAYQELDILVGIDDAEHNIEMLHPYVDTMFVFTQPWNTHALVGDNIKRVDSWEDFTFGCQLVNARRIGTRNDGNQRRYWQAQNGFAGA
jgi:5'(3')-deoxyribonucleotidase